uniref:Uncharacterized protein n=1 Tax=Arundo donax TaxID=35708 RepID=A0A0A9A989_ARUDO
MYFLLYMCFCSLFLSVLYAFSFYMLQRYLTSGMCGRSLPLLKCILNGSRLGPHVPKENNL